MEKRKLICYFCHHKTGTVWVGRILQELSKRLNIKCQVCDQKELRKGTEAWMQFHSRVDFSKLGDYTGAHMIRDPRDVIISGYFYHLWCPEGWCHISKKDFEKNYENIIKELPEEEVIHLTKLFESKEYKKFDNKTYQQILNSLPKENGILFEMQNRSKIVIDAMSDWDYKNKNILEMKYEDYILDPQKFRRMFKFYGLDSEQIKIAMEIARKNSFRNKSKRKLGEELKKSHLRKGVPGDWKNHFTEKHKKKFKELFGDVLIKLGYEKNNSW